ncbi:Uma2 family endonuclease [Nocardioides speluncae]|uniref:Uma2 family endonuclease n=1 Tax=Nocardioides speluncae TaxID=2670337 RepID=UPI00197D02F8|nr:Uma2 family endonuclease [Nocardioides speluncae]
MSVQPLPDWFRPPVGGFTADDFLSMPEVPRHTELIDGSLVLPSPRQQWHSLMVDLVVSELRRQATPRLRATREMCVKLAERQMPEPDAVVVAAEAFNDAETTYYLANDVVLAVEVVSPDSVERDHDVKPRRYAAAGIAHYWRIEEQNGQPAAYVYELEPASAAYVLTGIYHSRLQVTVPFDIDLDLTATV